MVTPFQSAPKLAWERSLTPAQVKKFISHYQEIAKNSKQAIALLEKALTKKDLDEKVRDDLSWYAFSAKRSYEVVLLFKEYIQLYAKADLALKKENCRNTQALVKQVSKIKKQASSLTSTIKRSSYEAIDYMGGALASQEKALKFVKDNLVDMQADLKAGKRSSGSRYKNLWW